MELVRMRLAAELDGLEALDDPASGYVMLLRRDGPPAEDLESAARLIREVSVSYAAEIVLHDAAAGKAFSVPLELLGKHVRLELDDIDIIGLTPAAKALLSLEVLEENAQKFGGATTLPEIDPTMATVQRVLERWARVARRQAHPAARAADPRSQQITEQATDAKTALRERLRESVPMMDAEAWGRRRGLTGKNPSAALGKYKAEGRIFSVAAGRRELYPEFQFDANESPVPAMKEILAAVPEGARSWPLLSWFEASNAFLGDRRPRDVMAKEPHRVLDAVRRFYGADD
jgi:hypothetical protein